ncbi:unnamed protein product, partial [Rotaria sp. Silwood2]
DDQSSLCSVCNKPSARSFCIGCEKYFCRKDFQEHEQNLSSTFAKEIVGSYDELFDLTKKSEKSNYLSLNVFAKVEQWKQTTMNKVEKVAEKVRDELIQLIEDQKITIIKQFEPIAKEIHSLQQENVIETDIDRLGKKLNEI